MESFEVVGEQYSESYSSVALTDWFEAFGEQRSGYCSLVAASPVKNRRTGAVFFCRSFLQSQDSTVFQQGLRLDSGSYQLQMGY